MTTFLEAVTEAVTPELASIAALAHEAPPECMQRALQGAVVTVLGALASKVRDGKYAVQVQQLVADPSAAVAPRSVIHAVVGAGGNTQLLAQGERMVRDLIGQSTDTTAATIGKMAGLTDGTALLAQAAALALTLVNARMRRDGLDAAGVVAELREERELLRKAMPTPVVGLLRVGDVITASYPAISDAPTPRRSVPPVPAPPPAPDVVRVPLRQQLMMPLAAAAAAFALLGWAYLRG